MLQRRRSRLLGILAAVGLVGCSLVERAPKCSDPSTVALVKHMYAERVAKFDETLDAQKLLPYIKLEMLRATGLDKDIRRYLCAGRITFGSDAATIAGDITYASQLDDNDDHFVETNGLGLNPFHVVAALKAAVSAHEQPIKGDAELAPAAVEEVEQAVTEGPGPTPNAGFQPLTVPDGRIALGRCHMDLCSWSRTLDTTIKEEPDGELTVVATLLGGTSEHEPDEGGPNYPASPEEAQIEWNDESHQVQARCSFTKPTLTMGGQVDELALNPVTGVAGVLESSAELYFQLCHSFYDGYTSGTERFGYNVADIE